MSVSLTTTGTNVMLTQECRPLSKRVLNVLELTASPSCSDGRMCGTLQALIPVMHNRMPALASWRHWGPRHCQNGGKDVHPTSFNRGLSTFFTLGHGAAHGACCSCTLVSVSRPRPLQLVAPSVGSSVGSSAGSSVGSCQQHPRRWYIC